MNSKVECHADPLLFIWLAFSLICIPIQWIFAWITAVIVHEFSHYLAIRFCGGQVFSVRFGLSGAVMETEHLITSKQIISALAGPIGSLILLSVAKWMPRVAICGFIHAVVNLLPVYPMDGGRVLVCFFDAIFGAHQKNTLVKIIGVVVCICLVFAGLYMSVFLRLGLLPGVLTAMLLVKSIKIPCKQRIQRVQ